MSQYARRWQSFYSRTGAQPPPRSLRERLSRRQTEIALLVADGFHNKAIAEMVDLAPQTIRLYVSRIYKRLGLRPDPDREPRAQITRAVVDAWAEDDDCQQHVDNFNIAHTTRENSAA